LLVFSVAPAAASAMTHVTELFTTAASGASHVYRRNIDWRLVGDSCPQEWSEVRREHSCSPTWMALQSLVIGGEVQAFE
jgi:hypothetical protein